MRTATALETRIRVRAYFLSMNDGLGHLVAWHTAERIEIDLAAKRSAASRKGAATRAAARSVPASAKAKPRRAIGQPANLH